MMTRKDYVKLAEALAATAPSMNDEAAYAVWYAVYGAIADVLEADNPRFDRLRFCYAAAGGRDDA